MKTKKLIFEFFRIILVLTIWFVIVYIGFNLAQGPDRSFDLGNGYEIIRWPGSINRWNVDANIPTGMGYYKKVIEERVTAFYVDSTWIVAKTYIHWFAINKQTHEVYYPYKSHEELCATIGFSFSPDKLITSYPHFYEKIWPHTKRFISVMIVLAIVPLIGFRRTGKIIKSLFKQVEKVIKKISK
ncbi:MAG: hypothetical protein GWN00_02730 [Aliifodinibius sp.]|nr:hypothetical protein [Fodinibius sp.]NIV10144.1 hypothetical protein [Fodinibius sp.]NIY23770.1 hypothetical protein [Fodinibius sp.]